MTAGLLASTAHGASARPAELDANGTAALINEVAPSVDLLDVEAVSDGDFVARSDRADVTIPTTSHGDVVLKPDHGTPISVGLPDEVARTGANVADDGTVVFDSSGAGAGAVDLAVQATDDGVRTQTVIADDSAPTEYTYTFDGLTPVLQPDGSVVLQVYSDDGVTIEAGRLEAPWAVDADGQAVTTRYRVEGSAVIQEVEHTGAAYPVVADPYVTLGWFIYINYTAADVKRYWSGSVYLNQAAAAAACAAIANVYGAAACGSLTAGYFQSIGDTFARAKSQGRGVQIGMTYVGFVPVQWKVV